MPPTDNSANAASDVHVDNTVELTLSASTTDDTIVSPIPIRAAHRAPFLQGPPWKRQWNTEQRQQYPRALQDKPATRESIAITSTSAPSTPGSGKSGDVVHPSTGRASESPERSPVSAALRVPYNPYDALFAPVEPYDVHTSLGRASYSAPHDEESWRVLVEMNRAIREGDIPRYTPSPSPAALTSAWDRIPSPVLSEFLDEGDSDKENYGLDAHWDNWEDPYAETWTGESNMPRGLYSQRALSPGLTQSFGADHYGHGSHNEHDIDLHNQEDVEQHQYIQLAQLGEHRSHSPEGYEALGTRGTTSSSAVPPQTLIFHMKIYTPEHAEQIYAEYESSLKRRRSVDSEDDDDEGGHAVKRRRSVSPSADVGSDTAGSTNWSHHAGLFLQFADSATQHELNEYYDESSDSSEDEFVAEDE